MQWIFSLPVLQAAVPGAVCVVIPNLVLITRPRHAGSSAVTGTQIDRPILYGLCCLFLSHCVENQRMPALSSTAA